MVSMLPWSTRTRVCKNILARLHLFRYQLLSIVTSIASCLLSGAEFIRSLRSSANIMDSKETTAEREFLQYLHGYPGEPDWLTALLYGREPRLEPDRAEMEQVSKHICFEMQNKAGEVLLVLLNKVTKSVLK